MGIPQKSTWVKDQKKHHDQPHERCVKQINEDFVGNDGSMFPLPVLDGANQTSHEHETCSHEYHAKVVPPTHIGVFQDFFVIADTPTRMPSHITEEGQCGKLDEQTTEDNLATQLNEVRVTRGRHDCPRELAQQARHINEDVQFCHPPSADERVFVCLQGIDDSA